ncbi:hybrid sensor histidine kinase/response regulator [Reichenbachiella ulvae]|uniref:histidine kinase n=1 Tax=Reichenbachiella ulvae TaxID=2980104 RepID=A0ABT3CNE6_9BACT|nr:PAS domain-containing sensor histidine kinase [Reichenbachiella ulvae]MCV9385206.1 PAS domain-containing protein [Reichenbachiella ulvae]
MTTFVSTLTILCFLISVYLILIHIRKSDETNLWFVFLLAGILMSIKTTIPARLLTMSVGLFNLNEIYYITLATLFLIGSWMYHLFLKKDQKTSRRLKQELLERKEIEDKLILLNDRRNLIEEALEEGIWDWDIRARSIYLSNNCLKLLDIESHTDQIIRAKVFLQLPHESQSEEFKTAIRGIFKGQKLDLELKFKRDDEFYWYHLKGDAIYDRHQKITRVVGTLSDVTERRDRELFIELDNELLKSLAGAAPIQNTLEYYIHSLARLSDNLQAAIGYLDYHHSGQNCEVVATNLNEDFRKAIVENFKSIEESNPEIIRNENSIAIGQDLFNKSYQGLESHMKQAGFVAIWSTPLQDSSGTLLGVLEIFSEIRKKPNERDIKIMDASAHLLSRVLTNYREEQSIMQIQSMFQSIFEQAAVGVALIQLKTGHLLQVNNKFCRMLNIEANHFLSYTLEDFVIPHDFKKLEEKLNLIQERSIKEFNLEVRFISPTKGSIWTEIHASSVMPGVETNQTCVAMIQDITERKFIEDNLYFHSEVLENMEECVMIVSADDHMLLYTNAKFEKLFGYIQREALGMNMRDFFCVNDKALERKYKGILEALEKRGNWKGEALNKRKDQNEFHSRLTISTFDHPKFGKTWISISDDITMIKEAEDSLRKIDRLNSVGLLAGGIAHDFNNILVGVFANLSIIREKLSEKDEAHLYLGEAMHAMGRAKSLTNQLLTFSKGGEPIKEDTEISKLVKDVVQFDLSGSRVKVNFEIHLPLWNTKVDRGQMQQVFSNLTINAKQAMTNGGQLKIKMENYETKHQTISNLNPGRYIKIQFKDSGNGIPQNKLDQVFDPYFTTKKEGSGLGLTSSFSIINRHGGHINVESEQGIGSTFTVYIPASEASTIPKKSNAKSAPKMKPGIRVLVMDDQEIILKAVGRILELQGFKVDLTFNGDEAIKAFESAESKKQSYDLVIMDLTIPGGKGGKDVINSLKAINPEVKAIVSSGYAEDPAMANYEKYGFKGVVPKPFNMDELIREIERVLAVPS